jgi:hypothetical protein
MGAETIVALNFSLRGFSMDSIPCLVSDNDADRLSDYLEFCHLLSLVGYSSLSWSEYLEDMQEEALESLAEQTPSLERRKAGWPVWIS